MAGYVLTGVPILYQFAGVAFAESTTVPANTASWWNATAASQIAAVASQDAGANVGSVV